MRVNGMEKDDQKSFFQTYSKWFLKKTNLQEPIEDFRVECCKVIILIKKIKKK